MNSDPGMDAERDAHLREALRHAPDASAGPSSGLSDAILRQARLATEAKSAHGPAPAAPASARTRPTAKHRTTRLSSLWSWLMQPPVAAGFASMMVATLVGVMWWGRPIDDPVREARAPEADAPTERAKAAAPRAEAPAAPRPEATESVTVNAPTRPAPPSPKGAVDKLAALKERAVDIAPAPAQGANDAVAAKKTAPTDSVERQAGKAERKAAPAVADEVRRSSALAKSSSPVGGAPDAPNDAPAAAPAPTTPAAAAVAAASPAAERKRDDEAVAPGEAPRADAQRAGASVPAVTVASAPGSAAALARSAAGQLAAQPLAPARGAASEAADRDEAASTRLRFALRAASEPAAGPLAVASPVAGLRAAVLAWPDVWTWQRGNGTEQAMNNAVLAWLGQLDDATRSRWQATPAAAASGGGQAMRLLRNGRLHSTVHIEAGAVRVETARPSSDASTGGARGMPRAPLPAATAAALRAALEQAAP